MYCFCYLTDKSSVINNSIICNVKNCYITKAHLSFTWNVNLLFQQRGLLKIVNEQFQVKAKKGVVSWG